MKAAILCLVAVLALAEATPMQNGSKPIGPGLSESGLCRSMTKNVTNPRPGQFVPKCDKKGNFQPQQCWASTGQCWCVDRLSGNEIPGTRTGPGQKPVNCGMENTNKTKEQTPPTPPPRADGGDKPEADEDKTDSEY